MPDWDIVPRGHVKKLRDDTCKAGVIGCIQDAKGYGCNSTVESLLISGASSAAAKFLGTQAVASISAMALASGSASASTVAAAAGPAGWVVGGLALGVSQTVSAFTHLRTISIVIDNDTDESFTWNWDNSYRETGNISVPKTIPPHSVVSIVFHHNGSLAGYIHFEGSKGNNLYVGATNPAMGHNKCKVTYTKDSLHIQDFRDGNTDWGLTSGSSYFIPKFSGYDNPSVATYVIGLDPTKPDRLIQSLTNLKECGGDKAKLSKYLN